MAWFQTKIRYNCRLQEKEVSETYLYQALSFYEVVREFEMEKKLLSKRMRDYRLEAVTHIKKLGESNVLFYALEDGDDFYEVKMTFESGSGKKIKETFLLAAINTEQATDRIHDWHKTSMLDYKIDGVDRVDSLCAVYHPQNEIWQGDWHNRIERMADEGRLEVGLNQTRMFDDDLADALREGGVTNVSLHHNGQTLSSVDLN